MLPREALLGRGGERDFRWRGVGVARIEAVADVVFALSLSLVVVSLEVPRTGAELLESLARAPAAAACFASLALLWSVHSRFHRRFGLAGGAQTWIEFAFLFVVLLYVYPARYLFSGLYEALVLRRSASAAGADGGPPPFSTEGPDVQALVIAYGLGFAGSFGLLAALYACAWSQRGALELDSVERVLTKASLHSHLASALVGLASVALAASNARWSGAATWLYVTLGPLHAIHAWLTRRAVERYRGKVPGAPRAS